MHYVLPIFFTISLLLIGCSPDKPTVNLLKFSCEVGNSADGRIVDVLGSDHKLYSAPDQNSDLVVNEKASAILGTKEFHALWSSERVQIQCESGTWVKVQVVEPASLNGVGGWVESKNLLSQNESGAAREYTESDIYWEDDTSPYKSAIVDEINRIHKVDPRCTDSLDPGTVTLSPSRSTPGNPTFFVTCGRGGAVENVWFTLQ